VYHLSNNDKLHTIKAIDRKFIGSTGEFLPARELNLIQSPLRNRSPEKVVDVPQPRPDNNSPATNLQRHSAGCLAIVSITPILHWHTIMQCADEERNDEQHLNEGEVDDEYE